MSEPLVGILNRNMESFELTTTVIEACQEAKGRDITVLNVSEVFDLSDYFIVVSGRSDRQVLGISNKILAKLNKMGHKPLSIEGLDDGHWVLMDFGDVIVHVFYEPAREHYDIEGLWINARRADVKEGQDLEKELRAA